MSIDLQPFIELLDYPIYVVATCSKGQFGGCKVGCASQVSIDPPRFLVCLSVENFTFTVAALARVDWTTPTSRFRARRYT
jgi:flavin reductase (DIM6/NTAB) family NADH-FMN oxidoreductase RutF